jgi:LacI family transcriptional regulator
MSGHSVRRVAVAIGLNWALPWHLDCYQGVLNYGREHGWSCVLDPFLLGLDESGASRYDGVVGRISDACYQAIEREPALPAVTLIKSRMTERLPAVFNDIPRRFHLAVDHLVSSGYTRLGHLTVAGRYLTRANQQIMTQAVAQHGFDPPLLFEAADAFEGSGGREQMLAARAALARWLESLRKPTGLVITNVSMARTVAQMCEEIGLAVPDDIGIVVLYGDELTCESVRPKLSCITCDYVAQGYAAAALLDTLMAGQPVSPLRRIFSSERVVVRESSDVFLCDDPQVTAALRFFAEKVRANPSVDEVAAHINISRRTLERRAEAALGCTVYAEMRRVRVAYLKRLLTQTRRSIGEIALDCGFTAATNFSRFFKQETGLSPGAYRVRHGQAHPAD